MLINAKAKHVIKTNLFHSLYNDNGMHFYFVYFVGVLKTLAPCCSCPGFPLGSGLGL